MTIDFSKIKDSLSKKRIELQNNDKLLLRFIADNKYIDDVTAKILLNKKSDRAFWDRIKKLISYNYIRKTRITINSPDWNAKPELLTAFSLDTQGCKLFGKEKIKTVGVQGEHLKHNLYIRRVAAIVERFRIDENGNKNELLNYETESVLDDYNDERIYIDKKNKYKIRPDILIRNLNLLIEIELNIKPDHKHYGKRLFWSQYLKEYDKTVWLVPSQKDKERLIKIFMNYAGESFKYDSVLDKKMIFSDAADKNLVVVLDDFFSNPETFLKLWTGLN
ncbi:MAG: hypothetical protein EVJ48_01765 [Candidatus Acidulodesulfobacterium acidiphilum]|uniref:Uncharacterized protein n=1 Tax=Candidatus Acidulodesulfobacterium acidiphilum TaxID=2597224 RepID=A0A520XGM9_9DELT|nr:MAG: hypothetical protein EVJ48_01765 [Candidatus Acidulodesulfobacterium acidiphilum]